MVAVEFLVRNKSPITCWTVCEESLIVARADGQVESSFEILSLGVPIIACTVKTNDHKTLISLDSNQNIHIHDLISGNLLRTIERDPAHSHLPGIVESDWKVDIFANEESIFFRSDFSRSQMALDSCKPHRVYLPIVRVDLSDGRRTLIGDNESFCLSLAVSRTSGSVVALLQSGSDFLLSINEQVSKLPSFDEWNAVACIASSVVVVGRKGIMIDESRYLAFPPSSNAVAKSPPLSPRKLHPGLTVVKKHSEVRTVPFLEDSLLGLSLAQPPNNTFPVTREHESFARKEIVNFSFSENGGNFIIKSGEKLLKLGVDGWEILLNHVPAEIEFAVSNSGSVWLISGRSDVKKLSDSSVINTDNDANPVSLARIDDEILASMKRKSIDFFFSNSLQATLGFDCVTKHACDTVAELFALDGQHLLIVSEGFARVVHVSENSSTVSFVSLESSGEIGVSPSLVPCTTLADVTGGWISGRGLQPDGQDMTIGAYIDCEKKLVQITVKSVRIDGNMIFSVPFGELILCFSQGEHNELFLLLSSETVVELTENTAVSWNSTVVDPSALAVDAKNSVIIGNFTGDLFFFKSHRLRKILRECKASVDSICVAGEFTVVSWRDGTVGVLRDFECMKKFTLEGAVKTVPVDRKTFVIYGRNLYVLSLENNVEMRSVELGHAGSIGALAVEKEGGNLFAYFSESHRIVKFSIQENVSTVACYSKVLPFEASAMVAAPDAQSVDLYILGSLEKIHRSALFILLLDKSRIGLVGLNDAVSVSAVLPFNEVREEPICIALWNNEMFPHSGLVAVGTKGQVRGRLILFDRESMHAIAKTSVPSSEIFCLAELSQSVLAIGCEDCVALLGLKPGPRTMPVVLSTLATLTTYAAVKNICMVDSQRFLIVTDNGGVQLLNFNPTGDAISVEAVLESPTKIVSGCHMLPGNSMFACSDTAGDLLVYRTQVRSARDTGIMTLAYRKVLGSPITASCVRQGQLVATLSNGSIFTISQSDIRATGQTT